MSARTQTFSWQTYPPARPALIVQHDRFGGHALADIAGFVHEVARIERPGVKPKPKRR